VLVNVAHALRDQEVSCGPQAMPLIYDEFDGEIAKDDNVYSSQKTASHLEIQETAAAEVDPLRACRSYGAAIGPLGLHRNLASLRIFQGLQKVHDFEAVQDHSRSCDAVPEGASPLPAIG